MHHASRLRDLSAGNPLLITAMIEDLDLGAGSPPEVAGQPDDPATSATPATPATHATPATPATPATRATGAVPDAAASPATLPGPAGARTLQAVAGRLASLAPTVREVLELLALTEGHLDVALVGQVLERPVDAEVAAALEAGVLSREQGRLGFTHPLYAERLRSAAPTLSPHRQLAIGRALLGRDPRHGGAILALRHLLAAGDLAEAALVRRAADQVLATPGSWRAAAAEAEALEARWRLESPGDRAWSHLGLRLADAYFRAGRRHRSWEVAGQVLHAHADGSAGPPHDPADILADAALALSRGQEYAASGSAVAHTLQQVVERIGEQHPVVPALLARAARLQLSLPLTDVATSTSRSASSATSRSIARSTSDAEPQTPPVMRWLLQAEQVRPLVDRALALLDEGSDPQVAAEVHLSACWVARSPRDTRTRIDHAERALACSRHTATRAMSLQRLIIDRLMLADRSGADAALAELRALVQATGDLPSRWLQLSLSATLGIAGGTLDRAAVDSERAFEVGERADEPGRWATRLAQYAMLRFQQAGEVIVPPVTEEEFARWNLLLHAGRAWLLAEQAAMQPTHRDPGPPDDETPALDELARLVAEVDTGEVGEGNQVLFATLLADAVWRRRRVEHAEPLIAALQPFCDLVAVDAAGDHCQGAVARTLASMRWLAGDVEEALVMERRAEAVDRRAGLVTFACTGELDAVVRAREDRRLTEQQARDRLLALAARAGSSGLVQQSRAARVAAGAPLRERLTARQLRVLGALAEGRTYAQAAERLAVSHGTVRKDAIALSAVLGVGGRDQAVPLGRSLGLC